MRTIVEKNETLTHLTLEIRTFKGKRQKLYTAASVMW